MSATPLKQNKIVTIESLIAHPRNYRAHPQFQIDRLVLSLQRFGQGRSIVIQDAPEHPVIVAGHGVVEAARALQWHEIRADVLPADWTPEQVEGYLVADNLHSDGASDNEELLAMLLQEQQDAGVDLASLGSDEETLRQMLQAMGDEYLTGDKQERAIPGTYSSSQIQDLLKRQRYRCYYCSKHFGRRAGKYLYHIDHTFPLNRVAGTGIPANDISYLVLACPSCNSRKSDRFPWEFPEGGRLL